MEINKIKFRQVDACVIDLVAPTTDIINSLHTQFHDISNLCTDWWVISQNAGITGSGKKSAQFISGKGSSPQWCFGEKAVKAVKGFRPIIYFADAISSTIRIGDDLLIDGYLFEVFKNGKAISKTAIDFCRYDELANLAIEWKQRFKNIKEIYKVTDRESNTVTDFNFDILTMSDYTNLVNINSPQNNYSYWLKCRDSEFEGYCSYTKYSDKHSVFTDSIQSEHFICPVLKYNATQINNVTTSELLEINSFLFKVLSLSLDTGIALSLSPAAYSCYSTGIAERGNVKVEEEFYQDSEINKCIDKFKHDLKFCK